MGAVLDDIVCPFPDPSAVNVLSGAVPVPHCDGVCQDTLHCASVDVAEKFGG